ncbi:MAG: CpaD family pilus assembly protein [Parvularculaceae bacterium]
MVRSMKSALICIAAAAAAGCATKFNTAEHALSIAEEHPISVDSQTVTMTIAPGAGLSGIDKARLRAFADSYMRNGHGSLTLTAPGGAGGQSEAVSAALYEFGVPTERIAASAYGAGAPTSDLILSYTHYVATPSTCGIWEGQAERDFRNMRSPNFGCSAQNNLAAMIGDPRDLIEPAEMSPPDAEARIRGVRLFRAGETPASATDGELQQTIAN